MCLITIGGKFDEADLFDFYSHNSDGLGIMHSDGKNLEVKRIVTENVDEAVDFYLKWSREDSVVHWRMRTHGDINLANQHPYTVLTKKDHGIDLVVMHNGVLHKEPIFDRAMSDTWHFTNRRLRPVLAEKKGKITKSFVKELENEIGSSNKLVFLDDKARLSVVNESSFVEYKGGLLSNTYAWSSWKLEENDNLLEEAVRLYPESTAYLLREYGLTVDDILAVEDDWAKGRWYN